MFKKLAVALLLVSAFQAEGKSWLEPAEATLIFSDFAGSGSGVEIARDHQGRKLILTANHVLQMLTYDRKTKTPVELKGFDLASDGIFDQFYVVKSELKGEGYFTVAIYRARPEFTELPPRSANLLPRADFALALTSSSPEMSVGRKDLQKLATENLPEFFPTVEFSDTRPNESVTMIGFPYQRMATEGFVIDNEEAMEILTSLRKISRSVAPFNPGAEMLIGGKTVVGMSGGGVFNRSGQLVGLIVRSLTTLEGVSYTRAVRLDYIQNVISQVPFSPHLSSLRKVMAQPCAAKLLP